MNVILKYVKNGIYTRQNYTFKRKGIRYYLFILYLKTTRKYYETIDDKVLKKKV